MGTKLNIFNETNNWISLMNYNLDAEIGDNIQTISCDTRDFHIIGGLDRVKAYHKPTENFEYQVNQSLKRLYKIVKHEDELKEYSIHKTEIFNWLNSLCEASGGYHVFWRFIYANLDYCTNWNLKYIRFIRDIKNPDNFIVCNNYYSPILYKLVIDNLDEEHLCAH